MSPPPLDGLLVIDLTRHLPGPLVARNLGDLGARVVKIEEPRAGDPVRQAPPLVGGASALAALLLAGHESVALDLGRPAAVAVLRKLLERADVLLESFRPGTLARFGIAPQALRRELPRLVICSVSGWGQDGPEAARAGHDLTYQAVAGTLAPTAAMPAAPLADLAGAWSATAAVLAALVARERGGDGAWIDQALLDGAVHANVTAWAAEAARPHRLGEPLPLTGALPCYGIYLARDGRPVALAALEPHFWRRFCAAAGDRALRSLQYDERQPARRAVAAAIARRDAAEWAEIAAREDLPLAPLLTAAEALEHPQVAARGAVVRGPDGLPRLAFPARFEGERLQASPEVPGLGAATRKVLRELDEPLAEAGGPRLRRHGVGARPGLRRRLLRWWLARRMR